MLSFNAWLVNTIYLNLGKRYAKKMEKEKKAGVPSIAAERNAEPPFEVVTEKKYRIEKADINGCIGEVVIPKEPNGKYVLYVHGGGFTGGSARERRSITTHLAMDYGYKVYAIDYRLAPENKYPVLLDDCFNYYKGLLELGYSGNQIILMGDSAGAQLVLSMGLRLRDENLPQPKGIASFSPPINYKDTYPARTENAKTDYMLGNSMNLTGWDVIFGEDKQKWAEPYISPVFGDYEGVAPIFIGVSDYETLLDDALDLYERLKKAGHKVQIDVEHGLIHAYVIFGKMRETKKSVQMCIDFLENGETHL